MSDKDEIKELFQKELGNYQAKVNPNLWNGIQAGLGSAGTAAGVGSSLGLIGKIAIGISVVAAITVGTILVVNNDENSPKSDKIVTDLKTEDSVTKEKIEDLKLKEEVVKENTNEIDVSVDNDIQLEDPKEYGIENTEEISNSKSVKKEEQFIEQPSNELLPKNTELTTEKNVQKSQSNPVEKIVNSTPVNNETTIEKEAFVSELSEVQAMVMKQSNQYVSFKTEGIPNNAYVVWNFDDGTIDRNYNPEHFYTKAGTYNVTCTVTTDQEEVVKNIQIEIKISAEIGDLPNVFTPNGDGNNDEFFVTCKNIKNFQLTIIDQQQNIIYTTNDVDFRWTGIDKNGQIVKEGIYYYILVAEDEAGNTINKYQQLHLQR
ncbi:T9SS type B sorting domain-containing protein [Brumimicrobium mesophilum]|uniref:T9SS type B sorting domain-containing protein n=1 Tax=Brumimicrobium mesophilum TaxID=392717 RepID=UPI000D1443DC|nr:gliding motility-associated C-terminal domain-containing protein [Brumimicrobium mesophilum]